ncbi:tetratricopeptide repeat protein [Hespellia stercorisuis]|uniref:Sel1 repeat-containing protein n=1 Tax=Hespellia stercorisuis DSM 15480 TaxID=1121950 RepID=A0A1M6WIB0_9FIRM|nr:tetratricopeptide repeat protein [Hespellia stercorisuis]SHK93502.1 Sel1 repeat-containing protein [Hespellia stercorisuis DSM 15480]
MDEGLKNLVTKAEQGEVDAMVIVGDCYNRGLHTEKNDQEAHKYYKMAADQGHVQASLMVAIDLLNGVGTVQDKKLGTKYLQIAADGGVAFAQYLLASMYKLGEIGFFGREQKAMKYFEMAAKQGDAKSQIELADLIMLAKKSNYTMDDMVFWLACAYLHGLNKQAEEESRAALQRLNHLISRGMPGGKALVEKTFEDVKKNYQGYLKNPS